MNNYNIQLQNFYEQKNDASIVELFNVINPQPFLCLDNSPSRLLIYRWDTETTLYVKLTESRIFNIIRKTLTDEFRANVQIMKKVGSHSALTNITKYFIKSMDITSELIDFDKSHINFTNGIVDLRTATLRDRTPKDLYTECNPYPYTKEYSKNMYDYVNNIFKTIVGEDQVEVFKEYMGYCLTGEISNQSFMVMQGHLARNGKSLSMEMYESAMPIYTKKIEEKAFYVRGESKRHKYIDGIYNKRIGYTEELDRSQLDIPFFKGSVGSHKITNEVLFSTTVDIPMTLKFVFLTNHDMNLKGVDAGFSRRGRLTQCRRRFVYKHEMEKIPAKDKHLYTLIDPKITKIINTDAFRNAFINVLLPYAVKFYKTDVLKCTKLADNFQEMIAENDKYKQFFDAHLIRTESTKDRVHKDDILQLYRDYSKLHKTEWGTVLNELKRCDYTYKFSTRELGTGKPGVVMNVKIRGQILDDDDKNAMKSDSELEDILAFLGDLHPDVLEKFKNRNNVKKSTKTKKLKKVVEIPKDEECFQKVYMFKSRPKTKKADTVKAEQNDTLDKLVLDFVKW